MTGLKVSEQTNRHGVLLGNVVVGALATVQVDGRPVFGRVVNIQGPAADAVLTVSPPFADGVVLAHVDDLLSLGVVGARAEVAS